MAGLRRFWNTLRPGGIERDIDRELAFHLAERIDDLRAQGLSHEEASRRARIQFGNVTLQAERTRDMDVSMWVDAFVRDLRYAATSLARTPGFTFAVVVTLALGIGANSAVFSAVDAVLVRPLPFPDADRLMRLGQRQQRTAESHIAPVRLEDWNRLNVTFEGITGHYTEDVSETSGELPERVRRALVAPRFLEVWGIAPALGRGFTNAEHSAAGPRAVLISDRYWRVRLGGDPNVLNRTIRIGAVAFPIIGVMPASFRFPDRDVDVWFPVALDFQYAQSRLNTWYTGIGRLKPGVTLEQARSNLAAVQAQLGEQYPDSDGKLGVEIAPLKETTVGGIRASLWVVFGGVSVLLLITCTNIAGLLLSRATHRRQEISIRLSLGASRVTVAMQLLVETFLLSLAGAALGLAVAAATAAGLRSLSADLPRMDEIRVDWMVVVYTLTTAMLVTVLCGILPAIRTGRDDVTGTLKGTTRTQVSGRHSLQWLLVGAQVTLSVVLLSAAGLLVRSFQELSRVDLGFDSSRVLTFRVSGDFSETVNMQRLANRINTTIDALRALPGVEGVATSTFLPGVPSEFENAFTLLEGRSDEERRMVAESRVVSPEYFATMKIPLLEGEGCRRQPVDAPRVILVNRAFVSRYLSGWPSPLGLQLASGTNLARAGRISGVVGDARERGIDRAPAPMVYACSSAGNPTPVFLVRTHGEPMALAQTVRLTVKELEPLRSVYNIAPLEERIDGAFAQNRLRTVVLVVFALAALLLTCVGLYGTLTYVVNLRRREVGLRLALGAVRAGIVRQFLGQGLRVVAVSCALGLGLALAFARLISGMLYGVSATDPYVLSMVVTVVLVVATLAAVVPAARASMIEPMRVLRE
jgi:putative ABC transport system permease protein